MTTFTGITLLSQMKKQSTMEKEQKPPGEDDSQTYVEDGVSTEFNVVTEGKAAILQPKTVFYNPVQEFNRDITIAFISEFAEEQVKERREKQKKEKLKEKERLGEAMDTDQGREIQLSSGMTFGNFLVN